MEKTTLIYVLSRCAALIFASALVSGCYDDNKGNQNANRVAEAVSQNEPSPRPSEPSKAIAQGGEVYSFISRFPEGSINSEKEAATPTKCGALILTELFGQKPVETLTLLSTYRYSYTVNVKNSDFLIFEAAKPYQIGGEVQAFIDLRNNGVTKRIFQRVFKPAIDSRPVWRPFSIRLEHVSDGKSTFVFGVDAIKDPNAAWVSFADAGIFRK